MYFGKNRSKLIRFTSVKVIFMFKKSFYLHSKIFLKLKRSVICSGYTCAITIQDNCSLLEDSLGEQFESHTYYNKNLL